MKKDDKINYYWKTCPEIWARTLGETKRDLSNMQPIFCCCGKLATGLHEDRCRKFQTEVVDEAIRRMEGKGITVN